ncbi:hypothetical protein [Streptomyces boluensis]|uniref:UDP-N-acetylmuramyl pentapeptide phosphotransferase/UDP-N-acetylglucosamine-1-phosphate transferase n=1 Tax=Streptomyces boluensis TaxID=1775135 RepID=A0A964XMJ3_9ACTN|nr:hypothetical protein [Streptomyces boluensis]NBE52837.1 hypothetical protein [Streptomyces boluensis]
MRSRTFGTALGAARLGYAALRRAQPGGAQLWERVNHAGRTVDLCSGPAVALGAGIAAATTAGLTPRARGAVSLAVTAAAVCGAYDDVAGAGDPRRGFRAHLSALRRGEVTSGAVKLLGIGAAGLAAGALLKDRPLDKALAGVVVAGTAHFVNLVDVRPARATAAVLALGAPGLLKRDGALAAAPMGAAAAVFVDDLDGRTMLGDTGAHALGAALGTAIVATNGRLGLAAHAAALVAATVCGDRVSRAARELPLPTRVP